LTLLPGGKVLAAGGFGSDSNALASAALYDQATGKWSPTGPLNQARFAHTATLLFSGKVLVSGGRSGSQSVSSAELYDPVGGTWNPTGSMSAARNLHTATLLNTGEVLVAGNVAPSSELYHPAIGTWSTTGSMNMSRAIHTATLLPTGEVLVAGGGNGGALSSAELYNRTSGTWSIAQSMSTDRAAFPAVLLPNGTVLVAGGDTHLGPTAACEFYDRPSSTWTVIGNMNQDRDWHTGTLLKTGKVLVTGGVNVAAQVLASAELYDTGAPPVQLVSAVSRKVHGSAGTFDIGLPLAGYPGIECRSGGTNGDYTMAFSFANTLASISGARVTSGTGSVISSNIDGNDAHRYIVNLTGVTNAQVITVSLTNVTDSAGDSSSAVSASMGILLGDVNASGVVTSGDTNLCKAQALQPVTNTNFRNDINASGSITTGDVNQIKQNALSRLPAAP
jgi:hypothetical protein